MSHLRTSISSALLVGFLFLTGCESLEYRPNAVGKEGEIIVVADSASWNGELGEAIRRYVSPYLGTLPAPEREFTLRHRTITSQSAMEAIQKQKNILFIAPLSGESSEASFLRSRLDEQVESAILNGESSVVSRPDLWRGNQQVVYLLGDSAEALIALLEERGDDVRYAFNTMTRARLEVDMFEKGRQPDLEDALMSKHGFAVNAQHDYFTAIDTTDFVWWRRVITSNSWRSMFMYYIDDFNPVNLTPEWIYEARQRLTETHIKGNLDGFVAIDFRRELTSENIDFKGRFAYESRGLWHMIGRDDDGSTMEYGMGGPFLNYTFYDEDTGRLYMIDGMVFAPGYDKREFLRQMEVIAHTFRTRTDMASTNQTS